MTERYEKGAGTLSGKASPSDAVDRSSVSTNDSERHAPAPPSAPSDHAIVLFDGVCNLCNASVNFIIDRDPAAYFRFASLQSELGTQLRRQHGLPDAFDSFVLVEHGKAHTRSAAALRVARHLRGAWKLLYACIIIPPFIRNAAYRLVAKNRYRWFGKADSCRLPSPELRARFFDP